MWFVCLINHIVKPKPKISITAIIRREALNPHWTVCLLISQSINLYNTYIRANGYQDQGSTTFQNLQQPLQYSKDLKIKHPDSFYIIQISSEGLSTELYDKIILLIHSERTSWQFAWLDMIDVSSVWHVACHCQVIYCLGTCFKRLRSLTYVTKELRF